MEENNIIPLVPMQVPLTEEEKDQKRHELIDMLCAMQDNFNEHKKEQQEHGLS